MPKAVPGTQWALNEDVQQSELIKVPVYLQQQEYRPELSCCDGLVQ